MVFWLVYSSRSLPSVAANAYTNQELEHYLLSITVQRYKKKRKYANIPLLFNKL